MEPRDRLRLLGMEMEMQRAWLAAYLDDSEVRAKNRRSSALWGALLSIARTRSLWIAAIGIAADWWRQRRKRTA
jgi:hypothetical protein